MYARSLVFLLAATSATHAATLELRVVTDGDQDVAYVSGGSLVNVFIQARLDGGGAATTEGLALWGANIRNTGDEAVDACGATRCRACATDW